MKRGRMMALVGAAAVAPVVPLPANADPLSIGTVIFGDVLKPEFKPFEITDEMLRKIERAYMRTPGIVAAAAKRGAPGVVDVTVQLLQPTQFVLTIKAGSA